MYCLPMRVLVEQTKACAEAWLEKLGLKDETQVHVLMGGEEKDDWDIHPERDAIIIGTQDMLLSRALNRGYAASRARWPMHFGLLNTDCLWIFDEIQLMGSGLATTAQLEAFRESLSPDGGNGCHSVWMSATMRPEWLSTVDFKSKVAGLPRLNLADADHKNTEIAKRWNATKSLARATATMGDAVALAGEVRKAHRPGTRTIVVVNTVKRACELYDRIAAHSSVDAATRGKKVKASKKGSAEQDIAPTPSAPPPKIVLLHSRFRPGDRKCAEKALCDEPTTGGTIIVSTQVIEAGVDVSATTLFTELAPWASLVQRFGRCNRFGDENGSASVVWVDLPSVKPEETARPYELSDLVQAREELSLLNDVGLGSLDARNVELQFKHSHVIRRKDLIDLFDTTPDLAGNDIDIDRYVREIEETDVRVFWRSWDGDAELDAEPMPSRDELCPAPIGDFKDFVKKDQANGKVFRRDFLEGKWVATDANRISPGQVFMIHAAAGGYKTACGWDSSCEDGVGSLKPDKLTRPDPDGYDDDGLSVTRRWQSIAQHTDDVSRELDIILKVLLMNERESAALRAAARWHDWGKAHKIFQEAIKAGGRPVDMAGSGFVAKAPGSRKDRAGQVVEAGFWTRYSRKHFRHELASALAVLQKSVPLVDADRDLVAYLIAAHHGKVRLSIRSFPDEKRPRSENGTPAPQKRFARGVWDGDELPATDLGGGVTAPAVALSLEPMELGLCECPPFIGEEGVGEPSWIERVLRLRDRLGPFRLAYLEAILRAADERASAAASSTRHADDSHGSERGTTTTAIGRSNT